MSDQQSHLDAVQGADGRQAFRLVDAKTPASQTKAAGGHSHGEGGHGGGGCGCGGHGGGGRGRGGQGGHGGGGCGCGGHGGGHGHAGAQTAAAPSSQINPMSAGAQAAAPADQPFGEELVIHSIPKVVRHPVLFFAMDALPVGESIVVNAPHQPQPLFDHLGDSENRYRVETLQTGPDAWRYRVTRVG